MAGTGPLTGTPYGEIGDDITSLLDYSDTVLHGEKYNVLRFSSTAARDAAIPVPEWGMLAVIGSSAAGRIVQFYNGSTWQIIYQPMVWTTTTPAQYTGTIGYGRRDNLAFVNFSLTSSGASGTNVSPTFLTLPAGLRPTARDGYGDIKVRAGTTTSSYLGVATTGGAVQVINMTIANTNTVNGTITFPLD